MINRPNKNNPSSQIGGGAKQKRVSKSLFITLVFFFSLILIPNFVSAFLISDQGTNVIEVATGNLTTSANLTISIYDNLTGGNLIFEQNFNDAIANGSWNVMINPNLEYGISYYKDYKINSEDLDFDGNERLEFQSSVGEINNVSFINFSLVNSCTAGSSIRLIYANGSVECEVDDDSGGSGSSNLTNYALKNQSEIFTGNITTSQTGFFGWLGSLASRITKLFVQDIDFNGTINGSGSINITGNITASYLMGDGSLLTNIPAGSESDPIFVAENTTLWNAINLKLNEDDQRYNNTALILSVNTTSNIMSLDFYNKSEVDNLISSVDGGNSSFNQSLTDILYYSIANPSNFINTTTGQVFNDTTLVLNINSSLWNHINTNEASWLSTYNATYDALETNNNSWNQSHADTLYADISVTGDNSSWNESHARTIFYDAESDLTGLLDDNYAGIEWDYNQTIPANAYADSIINATFNQSLTDTLYSGIEWDYNQTLATYNSWNSVWLSTYNATYDAKVSDNSSWNQSYANTLYADISVTGDNSSWNESHANTLYAGIEWDYNQSTAVYNMYNDVWLSTYNATYDALVTDNSSWNESHANTLYADISVTGDNSSWNESFADTLYSGIEWDYNQTLATYNAWNSVWLSTYNATYDAKVSDNSSWNQSLADTLYADISVTGDNSSWNESHARTIFYDEESDLTGLLDDNYAGIEWDYNQTIPANAYADTQINAVNTTANIDSLGYLNKSGTNANQDIDISPYNFQAGNLTLTQKITFSFGEIIDNIVNGWITITGSLQVSGDINATGNITTTDTFCFTADCSAKMYHNGSGIIISS